MTDFIGWPAQGDTYRINEFVRRQTPESKFSHFEGDWRELLGLIVRTVNDHHMYWHPEADFPPTILDGYREGVVKIVVPPERFMSSTIRVEDDTPLEATFGSRREDEESHLGIVSTGGAKVPAKYVEVILYHGKVLAEDGDAEGFPDDWHVISINASPIDGEIPFAPIARARNILEMEGGTSAKLEEKTKDQLIEMIKDMARATIFHSQHVMVEPLQAETVEAGPIAIETDGKGGGKVVENGEWPVRNRDDLYYPPEIDGMESLLLALACEGVKVTGPRFRRAVETTLDAIDNNADDPDDF